MTELYTIDDLREQADGLEELNLPRTANMLRQCDARIAELEADAERWAYIKRKLCFTGNGDGTCTMQAINLPADIIGWPEQEGVIAFAEKAIDAARSRT